MGLTPMPLPLPGVDAIRALHGGAARASGWMTVEQGLIDRFADLTCDRQWIHVDVDRARRESPYGSTIAHGFLTLSLLTRLVGEVFSYPNRRSSVNYGFDRVRFTSAVPAGSRIRANVALGELGQIADNEVRVAWDTQVEVEGRDRPALVARWLVQMKY
jgi:acyl dehydratase